MRLILSKDIGLLNVPDIDDSEKIRDIENRTKRDIFEILKNNCIPQGSGFREYSRAKKLLFKGLWIDSTIYDKQIRWVCDYLGL